MLMEYAAEVLRGWPADGARERLEIVKQGVTVKNGDLVFMQADGTVDKVGATKTKRCGLVVRGNFDSASAANSFGKYSTPQPTMATTAGSYSAAGLVTITVAAHTFVTGNMVTIAGVTPAAYNGTFSIVRLSATQFTYVMPAATVAAISVQGTVQLSGVSSSGKAVVLWGNYIVRTSNFLAGSWAPGSPVTSVNNQYTIAAGQGNADGTYTVTATNTIDPELGYCIRVQGATATETAHIVIVAF